jgi:cell division protein FtsB
VKGRRLFSKVMIAAMIIAAVYVILISDYSIINVGTLFLEKEDLKKNLEKMEKEQEELILEQEQIRKNKFELERLAREKLGMVKPGEKLFKAVVVDEIEQDEGAPSGEVKDDVGTGEAGSESGER